MKIEIHNKTGYKTGEKHKAQNEQTQQIGLR